MVSGFHAPARASLLLLAALSGAAWMPARAEAACGATNLTWYADAGTTSWTTTNNWATGNYPPATHNNYPNAATENAIIRSDWRVPLYPNSNLTLGCFEITSGTFDAEPTSGTRTMTISGDYFKNPYPGALSTNSRFIISMAGTSAQTFENVDPIDALTVSNPTSVTFSKGFDIKSTGTLTISAGAGTIYIDDIVTLNNTGSTLAIPSSATVTVRSGGKLIALGGITVAGVLRIEGGGAVELGTGETLSVSAGGSLQMAGSSGYVAKLSAYSGGTFAFNVAGSVNLSYFSIGRTVAAGMSVTGSIQAISNGDFHYPAAGGYALTLGAAAAVPATWTAIGFFNEAGAAGARSINATSYNVAGIALNNWSGLGGSASDTDPNNRTTWGAQAGTSLQVTNATAVGSPPATIGTSSADTLFGTFGFSLTQAATATDIASLKLTFDGTASPGDFAGVKVYGDANGNCVYNAGVDAQIGATLTPTGSPPSATLTLPAGALSPSGTTQKCVHVLVATSSSAQNNHTLALKIAATADVSNSLGYPFSPSGGPPVSAPESTIVGTAVKMWNGGNGTVPVQNWNASAADWTPSGTPTATDDCQVWIGYTYPRLNGSRACKNVEMPTGGTIDWNGASDVFTVNGSITVGTGYGFLSAANGKFSFASATHQSIDFETAFPGHVDIAKPGGIATVNADWSIGGNLTVASGTLVIASGYAVTVGGNVQVTAGSLILQPGATLKLSNGRTLTVNAGATLQVVGDASQNAVVTSTGTTASYSVVVNGTIKAQYYAFSNLGVAGVAINAGATIDSTYSLQNGSFTYPIGTSPTLLTLNRQVPGNALSNMVFDKGGSAATGAKSIVTNAAAGTLTISSYNGDLTNCCTTAPTYAVAWTAPTNTLKLTREATGPTSVNQGQTYVMGRYGFQQTQAGALFVDTSISSITLTLTGTGDASDVSAARLYYDSDCNGAGGALLGAGTFSGYPATATISGMTGALVEAHATAPPKRCIYVEYDVASLATHGATVGVEISAATDVANAQGFAFNGSYAPPVGLGADASVVGNSTTWNGGSSTAWATAANWSGGLPSANLNCIINTAVRNPVISAAGAVCKSVTIGNGNLTINAGQNLDVYGSFTHTGTLTSTGTVTLRDNGTVATNQTVQSANAIALSFNKTAGGAVLIGNGALTVNGFSIPASRNFTFKVQDGDTLTLPNGATIASGVLQVDGGGVVKVASGQTIAVNGGTFRAAGTNDAYPQDTSSKAQVTNNGTGTWNFTSTSGTVDLTGFLFDWIGTNGLVIGGTTTLSNLNGGQFRNLSSNYASVKAIQINTTGAIPGTASNVGWNWGPSNTPPTAAQTYSLAASTGCGGQTMSFDQWFGDFFVSLGNPVPSTKVTTTGCTLNIAPAASPVSLTSLRAVPYDSQVAIEWVTGLEVLHQGFNVYRSLSPATGFAQINPELVRNSQASGSVHGSYRFVDTGVANGITYHYRIEDIASDGRRTLHGPVAALPRAGLGNPPSAGTGTIVGANPGASPDSSADPFATGSRRLAEGVTLLARTGRGMRVRIDVPAPQYAPVAGHSPFESVSIAGYSSSAVPGAPALPERVVMLEIPSSASASIALVSAASTERSSSQLAPAPAWGVTSGLLGPQWSHDTAAYAVDAVAPAAWARAGTVVRSGARAYLPLEIHPVRYNPAQSKALVASSLVLDVFLGGAADWNDAAPVASAASGPWAHDGGLRVRVEREGVYRLTHADLAQAGVDGPFTGAAVSSLRMFYRDGEIPLQIDSADPVFGAGDSLVFYAPFAPGFESRRDTLVLVVDAAAAGARIASRDATPTGYGLGRMPSHPRTAHAELDRMGFFAEAYGEGLDHVVWGRFWAPAGTAGEESITASVDLPRLVADGNVELSARIKGSPGYVDVDAVHHLRVHVNGSTCGSECELVFVDRAPFDARLTLPASLFVAGSNTIRFEAVGDLAPGDYDIITLDSFDVTYPHEWSAEADQGAFTNLAPTNQALSVGGFTGSDVVAYDVTTPGAVARLDGGTVNGPAAGEYSILLATPEVEEDQERRVWLARSSALPKPAAVELARGSDLLGGGAGADVVYIGTAELLGAARPLAELRERQGHRARLVDLESIYAEFGQGTRSSVAIKEFLRHAVTSWRAPALKYVVLVGDASYDPKDSLGHGHPGTLPTRLLPGQFMDFASDNWFVAFGADDSLPSAAVGRIPGDSPALVSAYVEKVLAYEDGAARPDGADAGRLSIVADEDQLGGEGFVPRAEKLGGQLVSWNDALTVRQISRASLGDAATKQEIADAFGSGSMFVHYLGHGAENLWAGAGVFTAADAGALSNSKLPIVVAMNCLNGSFVEADPSSPAFESMADKLLFNASGGAVAVWASSSFTSPDVQVPFQQAFYEVIARNPGIRLGDAVRLAKVQGGYSAGTAEVVRSWTLFGDPMVAVSIPQDSRVARYADPVSVPQASGGGGDDDDGGFFSCGTTGSGGAGGGRGGPSPGAAAEAGLLLLALFGAWRMARRSAGARGAVAAA